MKGTHKVILSWKANLVALVAILVFAPGVARATQPIVSVLAATYFVNADPTLASDAYDGTQKVRVGETNHGPKRTLKGAMAIEGLTSGDVVHAAPGIYNEGVMPPANSETTSNRVVVVPGVALVADEGPEVTVIEGYVPPTTPTSISTNGGPTSVRCVTFAKTDTTGYVKGFTLRNGSTCIASGTGTKISTYRGGGICYGTAIDCVISNCFAVRGGAAGHATLIRSTIGSCDVVRGLNSQGGKAGVQATASIYCSFYDSYVSGTSTFLYKAVNCRFVGSTSGESATSPGVAVNCHFDQSPSSMTLTSCLTGSELVLDAYRRPTQTTVVDKGSVASYVYPAGFESEAGKDLLGRSRIVNGKIDIGCYQSVPMTFYVDAVNGNDAWDGLVATNAAPATSTHGPRQTLAGSMKIEDLSSGDEVCALKGTYDRGEAYDSTTKASNRVVVATGVSLFSAEGPAETVIEGALSEVAGGIGPDAVRGVFLSQKASVRGFTIQGGATPSGVSGGGIYLSANSAAIDCRIVDNLAGERHGACSYDKTGVLIRCYVCGNSSKKDNIGHGAGLGGYFNCVFDGDGGDVYAPNGLVVNCSFNGKASFQGNKNAPGNSAVYNSIFRGTSPARTYVYRCQVAAAALGGYLTQFDGTLVTNTSAVIGLDEQYRPTADSLALDFGNPLYAKTTGEGGQFPDLWAAYANSDYAGGQRVYNGMIDAGAGEYDWRSVFGQALGKGVTVTAASADVTAEAKAVRLASEASCEIDWLRPNVPVRTFVATLEDAGADSLLMVKTNGVVFAELASGAQTYRLDVPQDAVRLTFEYAGAGSAVLSGFRGEKGLCLIFR